MNKERSIQMMEQVHTGLHTTIWKARNNGTNDTVKLELLKYVTLLANAAAFY